MKKECMYRSLIELFKRKFIGFIEERPNNGTTIVITTYN